MPGEKLFVDYAGHVAGASNYTYACATERQTTADSIGAQVRALEFIGGVPRLIEARCSWWPRWPAAIGCAT